MSYQVDKPVANCDWCGRFVSWLKAEVRLVSLDTSFSAEDYNVMCPACHEKHAKDKPGDGGRP